MQKGIITCGLGAKTTGLSQYLADTLKKAAMESTACLGKAGKWAQLSGAYAREGDPLAEVSKTNSAESCPGFHGYLQRTTRIGGYMGHTYREILLLLNPILHQASFHEPPICGQVDDKLRSLPVWISHHIHYLEPAPLSYYHWKSSQPYQAIHSRHCAHTTSVLYTQAIAMRNDI